jgi:hypothetical protein
MTPIAIKVVFGHQALPYAVLLTAASAAIFYFVSKLVDLQQAQFAVRMTGTPELGAEPRRIIHGAYRNWLGAKYKQDYQDVAWPI